MARAGVIGMSSNTLCETALTTEPQPCTGRQAHAGIRHRPHEGARTERVSEAAPRTHIVSYISEFHWKRGWKLEFCGRSLLH